MPTTSAFASSAAASTASSLRPLPEDRFGYWEACHLLNRAGFGATPQETRKVADLGLEEAVKYVVRQQGAAADEAVTAAGFDGNIMRPYTDAERQAYRRAQEMQDEATVERFRRQRQARQADDRRQLREVQRWWFERLVATDRPLIEKMTLFWHGHFATSYRGTENSYHLYMQNQLFRRHALGSFAELCQQIIRDPAMLAYLNNDNSRSRAPNENLARELMELFTLGEGNGYAERDIKEGARALTGYTFDHNEFIFRNQWHDTGSKRILGAAGNHNGDDFVKLILNRPEASQFICLKLYRYFVNDLPDGPDRDTQRYILALASEFRRSGYSIASVLEQLFSSAHFYEPANVRSQIKSPIMLAVGSCRMLGLPVPNIDTLLDASALMGQNLFLPPSVKGWEGGRSWINTSTLFVRQNLLVHLLTGAMPGQSNSGRGRREAGAGEDMFSMAMRRRRARFLAEARGGAANGATAAGFNAMHLLEDLHRTHHEVSAEEAALYLLRLCLGADVHESRQATVVNYVRDRGLTTLGNDDVVNVLCLITSMPEFQLC